MNKLLPKIEELEPIVDSRQTFSDSPMKKEFDKLEEIDKLQVLCDIVKQTMLYSEFPNPNNDTKLLIGDDYTASIVLKQYIESLNIHNKTNIVLVTNKKKIDLNNHHSAHFALLVEGINNDYLVDPTPSIGYGIGETTNLQENDLYSQYTIIDDKLENILYYLRLDLFLISTGKETQTQIDNLYKYKELFKNEIYNGLIIKLYNCIQNSKNDILKKIFKEIFQERIDEINKIENENDINKIETLKLWQKRLDYIIKYSDDYKSQQKLIQYIISESKKSITTSINNQTIDLRHITPRLMWETKCNVVIIKPSSYLAKIEKTAIDIMIPEKEKIITSYDANLGEINEYGLKPMSYFHPHGLKYEFQMNGPGKVILVNDEAQILNERKHFIRKNFTQNIAGTYVTWFNGQKVLWDPNLNTNLVHSTDDAPETSIHFLAQYPEYQSFTRFNYPNPILRKEKK